MRHRREFEARVHRLLDELASERSARHRAELEAAAARGEMRGYKRAIDDTTIAIREAARAGQPFEIGAMR